MIQGTGDAYTEFLYWTIAVTGGVIVCYWTGDRVVKRFYRTHG